MDEPTAVEDDGANEHEDRQVDARPGQAGGGAGSTTLSQTSDSSATVNSTTPGGSPSNTGSDGAAGIEIDLLTLSVLEGMAREVAKRCQEKLPKPATAPANGGSKPVVLIATPTELATIAAVRRLHQALKLLATRMEAQLAAFGRESATGEQRESGLAAIAASAGQIGTIVTAARAVIDKLIIEESVHNRAVGVAEDTVAEILAFALVDHHQPVVVGTAAALRSGKGTADALIETIVTASEGLRAFATGPKAAQALQLLTQADALLAPILGGVSPLANGLAMASLFDDHCEAVLLVGRPLAAGGAVWTRKHLFTAIGLADPLSFSAGAAILFSLTDVGTGNLLTGDLLYATSGRIALPRDRRILKVTNIRSRMQDA